MPRTRGAKKAPKPSSIKTIAEATAAVSSTTPKVQLQPDSTNPPKLFILPKDTSAEARIALLENPKTSELSRYLCCPNKGFYEFTKVGPPKTTPRSWLIAPPESQETSTDTKIEDGKSDGSDFKQSEGYVAKSSDLFIATPVDPLFLILPTLAPSPSTKASASESKRLFLAGDDYLDALNTNSPHFRPLLRIESIRKRLEMRMASVCDTVDAGDENMYRLNESKLFGELLGRAEKMVEKGLPASMEEKLIQKALEVPVLSVTLQRGESSITEVEEKPELNILETSTDTQITVSESIDTQSTTSFADSTTTQKTTSTTTSLTSSTPTPAPLTTPENIPHLLRLKTAFNFLLSSYLPPHLLPTLKDLFSTSTTYPFTDLETHLKQLADLRRKAMEARALTNDFSRKRGLEDEEMNETRAEKKRKVEVSLLFLYFSDSRKGF